MAESRAAADQAFDRFLLSYEAKYPKAAECLAKDRDVLLTFYDFPAEHWQHIRTTNPIELRYGCGPPRPVVASRAPACWRWSSNC